MEHRLQALFLDKLFAGRRSFCDWINLFDSDIVII